MSVQTALNRHRKETQAQLKKYEFDLKKYEVRLLLFCTAHAKACEMKNAMVSFCVQGTHRVAGLKSGGCKEERRASAKQLPVFEGVSVYFSLSLFLSACVGYSCWRNVLVKALRCGIFQCQRNGEAQKPPGARKGRYSVVI